MTYKVPESKRSIAQNRFEFELPDGTEVSMPKAKYLTVGQIEKLNGLGGEVSLIDVLELFDEKGPAEAVRTLDSEQLADLMEAWQVDSGIKVGESSASEPNS